MMILPVAYVAGHTTTLRRTACHCQMTAAARKFWPSSEGLDANKTPAPFGRLPAGTSSARAATANAVGVKAAAFGITSWKSTHAALKPVLPRPVGAHA